MKSPTKDSLWKAYWRSLNRTKDEQLTSAATSAGLILPEKQKRGQKEGWQVFVKLIKYSDAKLKKNEKSGGLFTKV